MSEQIVKDLSSELNETPEQVTEAEVTFHCIN